jgi:predicted PurR-regulated permease PerM
VEYAGAIASAIPPVILAFGQGPGTVLGVVVVYTVLHVIEGYVLTPLLARASVRLPPGVSLGTQALLGTLAGPLGLTFATPLLVVGVSAVQTWREEGPRGEQV